MQREQIVKLTCTEISEALWKVINQLSEGKVVDLQHIMETPEMEAGNQCYLNQGPDTIFMNQELRKLLQCGILRELALNGSYSGKEKGNAVYAGTVSRERQADLVLALCSSAQSKELMQDLSQANQACLIDLEMIKEMFPEFNKGWGAARVHEEAKKIRMQDLEDKLALGQNVVVACTSESLEEIKRLTNLIKASGYTINVHYLDGNPYKVLGQVLSEFVCDGRYREPESVLQFVGANGENLLESLYKELCESGTCNR